MKLKYLLFLLIITLTGPVASAQQSDQTFTVEGYYKAKWGYADEFIDLDYRVTLEGWGEG